MIETLTAFASRAQASTGSTTVCSTELTETTV